MIVVEGKIKGKAIKGYEGRYKITENGEERKNSKLTNEQVKWIRENYIKGSRELGARPLARKFGVTKTCIYYIVTNKSYKEVAQWLL